MQRASQSDHANTKDLSNELVWVQQHRILCCKGGVEFEFKFGNQLNFLNAPI